MKGRLLALAAGLLAASIAHSSEFSRASVSDRQMIHECRWLSHQVAHRVGKHLQADLMYFELALQLQRPFREIIERRSRARESCELARVHAYIAMGVAPFDR